MRESIGVVENQRIFGNRVGAAHHGVDLTHRDRLAVSAASSCAAKHII
jgi:hypothetical protein